MATAKNHKPMKGREAVHTSEAWAKKIVYTHKKIKQEYSYIKYALIMKPCISLMKIVFVFINKELKKDGGQDTWIFNKNQKKLYVNTYGRLREMRNDEKQKCRKFLVQRAVSSECNMTDRYFGT